MPENIDNKIKVLEATLKVFSHFVLHKYSMDEQKSLNEARQSVLRQLSELEKIVSGES